MILNVFSVCKCVHVCECMHARVCVCWGYLPVRSVWYDTLTHGPRPPDRKVGQDQVPSPEVTM